MDTAPKNGSRPPGYILTRVLITAGYGTAFAAVLMVLLTGQSQMSERESNLVFLLAGALSTGLKDIVAWWFAVADTEPGESSQAADEPAAQAPAVEAPPTTRPPQKERPDDF